MHKLPKSFYPKKPKHSLRVAGTAGVAVLALTLAANAADPVQQQVYEPLPVQDTLYDWSGAYLGAMLGYTWGEYQPESMSSVDDNGYIAGGYAGLNFQSGSLVFGIEGDFAAAGLDKSYGLDSVETDMIGNVRGRIGYAFDRVLAYGAGGAAFANVKASDGLVSDENWQTGYTVGAGVEAAMTDNLLARVEYMYTDFGKETYALSSDTDIELKTHTVRAGLAYKF